MSPRSASLLQDVVAAEGHVWLAGRMFAGPEERCDYGPSSGAVTEMKWRETENVEQGGDATAIPYAPAVQDASSRAKTSVSRMLCEGPPPRAASESMQSTAVPSARTRSARLPGRWMGPENKRSTRLRAVGDSGLMGVVALGKPGGSSPLSSFGLATGSASR
eukprot:1423431-Pleurochrysis_carterae.AAC.1